ncbi:50S ribosomal protein L21 [Bacteroidales bacterium OttesenSCG-928-M11]|nr:50S ribosomal protein L21 [Bacteroidales bacterium OttesenSCG-928-M11]
MYVIVDIQGQQFKVEKDQKLFVHHLGGEEGAKVEFEKVLLADNNGTVTVGTPVIEGAKVVAEIIKPLVKGDKVLVFKKKRRKGYRKLNGHRQQFSQIVIKEIQA